MSDVNESLPRSTLVTLGYGVVQVASNLHYLNLGNVQFKVGFVSEDEAWNAAQADLQQRLRNPVDRRPDFQAEAQKLGFEVTAMAGSPKYGWQNRDLDVCSLRHDFPTAEEAWRAAARWARRFPQLWKE